MTYVDDGFEGYPELAPECPICGKVVPDHGTDAERASWCGPACYDSLRAADALVQALYPNADY